MVVVVFGLFFFVTEIQEMLSCPPFYTGPGLGEARDDEEVRRCGG